MLNLLFSVFLCLLSYAGLTVAAPATRLFGEHPSAGLGNSLANITSTLAILPHSNASNSDPAICHVGKTKTVLIIRLIDNHPLDPLQMSRAINAAKTHVDRIIEVDGDGWLPASKDPFRFDFNVGISITARSIPNQHLTWGILGSALQGLLDCLIWNEWYEETRFQIFDGSWGHVGDGVLARSQRRLDVKESLSIDGLTA